MSWAPSPADNHQPEWSATDRTLKALDFVHGLLLGPGVKPAGVPAFLAELARVFAARGAGLATLSAGAVELQDRVRGESPPVTARPWPWEDHPELLLPGWTVAGARELSPAGGTRLLVTAVDQPEGKCWLAWLEDGPERAWSAGEKASLTLAAELLAQRLGGDTERAGWSRAIEQKHLQRRLEEAATLTGRLAHDFGNILTGVLGFADLALSQLSPNSAPYRHVREMYQAAQRGAQLLQKLALFSRRRHPGAPLLAALPPLLAEETTRVQSSWGPDVVVRLDLEENLPLAGLDSDSLRQVLGPLLDNAREAIRGRGEVTLSARLLRLTEGDCLDFAGSPEPGAHLEIAVSDTGVGIPPDVRRRLLTELFFTTKLGHRGLGLAVVYGVLQGCRGGLHLGPGPRGGTTARVVVPRASLPALPSGPPPAPPIREKVLVVDDDPSTLEVVCTILTRAGYRVQPAGGGAQALDSYRAAVREPFGLVLSDVVMPAMTGFDLARVLLGTDPGVNILFLTGQAPASPTLGDPALRRFPLLPKPFRPEGLLQAVRAALDRGAPRPTPAAR